MMSTPQAAFQLPADAAVVCHDAGAANVIIAGLRRYTLPGLRLCMQGPAATAWQLSSGKPSSCVSLEETLEGASMLLSGTGWASDLEHRARELARRRGVHSVALLDHWVNYPQRFVRDGTVVMPDEIWVSDEDALRLAHQCFDGTPLRLVENWYFQEQVAQLAPPMINAPPELLYLAEPVRSDWGRDKPGEFQALDYFADRLSFLGLPANLRIRLRPHPSDPASKYDSWISTHPELTIELDQSSSMAEALTGARWVAGCESYGLVLALAAGRIVYSTLPPWAPACRLPQAGLIRLAALERTT